jgi:hypothetical protein
LSFPVACVAQICQTTFNAPAATWTFAVTLYSGTSQTGSVVAQGSTAQTLAPGANSVSLTFNPIVASVGISLSAGSLTGAGSATVMLTPMDASGATIIGPQAFLPSLGASPAPLTLGFANTASTTLGDFALSPSSFATPATSGTLSATLSYNGGPVKLQFPILEVEQLGKPVGAGGQVVALPAAPVLNGPTGLLNHDSLTYGPGVDPDPYTYYTMFNGDSTISAYVADAQSSASATVNGGQCDGLTALAADGTFWYFDCSLHQFGKASLTPEISVSPAPFPAACGTLPSTIDRFTRGTDGNLWYAMLTTQPKVGYITTSSDSCPAPITVGAAGTSVAGLVGGPGDATFVDIDNGDGTDSVYSVKAGSSTVTTVGTFGFHIYGFGYSTYDGNLYAQAATGNTIYAMNPSTGAVSVACRANRNRPAQLLDSHAEFARLPDGTLAYAAPDAALGYEDIVRIAPGAGCVTVQATLPSFYLDNQEMPQLFAIPGDGSSVTASDGGNISHLAAL